jgi:hypothetical protein
LNLWTFDLGLSDKGPIWQATKIPAQARLALRGVGHSLKHSSPKALLSSVGVPPPLLRSDIYKKKIRKQKKWEADEKKKNNTVGVM